MNSFFIVLFFYSLNIETNNSNCHTNNCKSSLTSLVACFILGEVYCKPEFNKDDMPVVLKKTPLTMRVWITPLYAS